jgi:hypothetical protein
LSTVDWSSGVLSKLFAFAGSRLLNLDPLATRLTIAPNTYYAWSPRMIHRGNFNTSDDLSSAMVVFLDQTAKAAGRKLTKLEPDTVRQWLGVIDAAIVLDDQGNIARVDQARLRSLDGPFQANFVSYFNLRTRIDLYQL